MKIRLQEIIFPAIFSLTGSACFSQWNPSASVNTPVCTFTNKQIDLRMTGDGHGGAFIAWKDYRQGGIPDIYIQRMDSLGYPLWTADGVALCTDPADQSTPAIVTDMKGGAIVAWSDWRSGVERDLYAQRIDANGNVKWTTDGVGVANKPEREHNEKIISDGNGGAIIVWEQQDNVNYWWNIWLQRIDSMGAPVWIVGGMPVGTVANYRLNPKVQKDNNGGAFICWQEWSGFDYDIYVQHIDKNGNYLFGNNGVVVCAATGAQLDPKIDPDSTSKGVIIAWTDKRNTTDYDIYAQRVDSAGNMLWATNGVPVVTGAGGQSAVDFLSNPKVGGTIFAWKDSRNGANNNDIYAQKLDLNGVQKWTVSGVSLCSSIHDQVNPSITGDGLGGAIVTWQDSSAGQWDIYSQRVDNNGNVLWTTNGVAISIAAGNQTSPKNVSDGAGGCIYAWQDTRTGTSDIYAHHLFFNGSTVGITSQNNFAATNCFPNPFEHDFTLNFNLAREEKISVSIFNLMGEKVAELISTEKITNAGSHSLKIKASDHSLAAGVYTIQFTGEGFSKAIKMVKTK